MSIELSQPGEVDLDWWQGADFQQGYSLVFDDELQPLLGYRATAQIRKRAGGDLLLDLDAYLTVDTDEDIVWLDVPATVTRSLLRSGRWDLFLIDALDPDVAIVLAAGSVLLHKAVTVDD